jgi:hypothetical protein
VDAPSAEPLRFPPLRSGATEFITLAYKVRKSALFAISILLPAMAHSQVNSLDHLHGLDQIGRKLVEAPCVSPKLAKKLKVQNRHEIKVFDEVKVFKCTGLETKVYVSHISKQVSVLPVSLTLYAPVGAIPAKFQVGALATALTDLGKADAAKRNTLRYVLPSEHGGDSITFTTENGRIKAINWNWDVD